jgi:hypothetical protein
MHTGITDRGFTATEMHVLSSAWKQFHIHRKQEEEELHSDYINLKFLCCEQLILFLMSHYTNITFNRWLGEMFPPSKNSTNEQLNYFSIVWWINKCKIDQQFIVPLFNTTPLRVSLLHHHQGAHSECPLSYMGTWMQYLRCYLNFSYALLLIFKSIKLLKLFQL